MDFQSDRRTAYSRPASGLRCGWYLRKTNSERPAPGAARRIELRMCREGTAVPMQERTERPGGGGSCKIDQRALSKLRETGPLKTPIRRRNKPTGVCWFDYNRKTPARVLLFGMQAAGFVLVGGRSSRMGQDKAFLMWNSRPLVADVAEKAASVAGNVVLIGERARYRNLGLECLPDLRPGMGPLGGIETALKSGRGEFNLILACDMPGLRSEWLYALLEKAQQTDALCTAIAGRGWQDASTLRCLSGRLSAECPESSR